MTSPLVRPLLIASVSVLLGATCLLRPQTSQAQEDDWSVSGGSARTGEIVRRYQQLLERNPSEGLAFRKMLEFAGTGTGLNRLIETYRQKTEADPAASNYPLILGHLLKRKGDHQEALLAYEEALRRAPDEPLALMGRGQMRFSLGQNKEATEDFERALAQEKDTRRKQEILRKLADLAFAQRQWDRAQEYYDRLVELEPRNESLRMEYAQVLIKYKRYDRALEQYQQLLGLAGRDVKARATALRDMGELYEMLGNSEEALKTYKKGQSYVATNNWLYREIERRIVSLYRREDRLKEYVDAKRESWKNPDYDEAMLLGELVMELGDEAGAYEYYTLASKRSARATEPRLQMIQILKRRGDFKAVFDAYTSLIRVAPGQSQFQFDLAQLYLRNGKREEAERTFSQIRSKFRRDTDTLTKLADTYMRLGMNEDALSVYKQLVRTDPKNESFLVSLGEFHYQNGDLGAATATWERLLRSNLPTAQAHAQLGLLMVEHNMVERGIDHYERAAKLEPGDLEIARGLAFAYEAGRRWEKAIALWEGLMSATTAAADDPIVEEARGRIISLYKHQNKLRNVMREFKTKFEGTPADLQAGRFLAEAYARLNEPERAIAVWKRIVDEDGATGQDDIEGLMALEKLYTKMGQSEAAIKVLQQLAELRPARAKEYYNRIADLSLSAFKDEQAVEYAKRALEKNPDDAASQARLGHVYAKMQRQQEAIKAYEMAIDLDPRAFDVMMSLAGLLMEAEEGRSRAMDLYLKVAKASSDEALVLRASRLAMGLVQGDEGLEQVEAQLAPQLFSSQNKEVYRTLLLEIYTQLLTPLLGQKNFGTALAPAAQAKLDRIASRAYPVLLDAMQSGTTGQRVFAMHMLASLQVTQAAPLLGQIAADKESPLRMHAIVALAQLGDARGNPGLELALESQDSHLVDAAIWALGASRDKRATVALLERLKEGQSSAQQAMIAVSLGRAAATEAAPQLRALLRDSKQTFYSDDAALAATYALGMLRDKESVALLQEVMTTSQTRAGELAAWALSRLEHPEAVRALALAYWDGQVRQRERGRLGLLSLSQPQGTVEVPWAQEGALVDARRQKFNRREFWASLGATRPLPKDALVAAMMATHSAPLHQAISTAIASADPAIRIHVMHDLGSPLLGLGTNASEATIPLTPAWRAQVRQNAGTGGPGEAAVAVRLLAQGATAQDKAVMESLLERPDLSVRLAALDALAQAFGQEQSVMTFAAKALSSPDPTLRAHAARALAVTTGPLGAEQASALTALLQEDKFLSVRVEAANTLGHHRVGGAIPVMLQTLETAPFALQKALLRRALWVAAGPTGGPGTGTLAHPP